MEGGNSYSSLRDKNNEQTEKDCKKKFKLRVETLPPPPSPSIKKNSPQSVPTCFLILRYSYLLNLQKKSWVWNSYLIKTETWFPCQVASFTHLEFWVCLYSPPSLPHILRPLLSLSKADEEKNLKWKFEECHTQQCWLREEGSHGTFVSFNITKVESQIYP